MRKQRIAMVQTKDQYILVHKAVKELFQEQLRMIDAHPYENVDLNGMPVNREEHLYERVAINKSLGKIKAVQVINRLIHVKCFFQTSTAFQAKERTSSEYTLRLMKLRHPLHSRLTKKSRPLTVKRAKGGLTWTTPVQWIVVSVLRRLPQTRPAPSSKNRL
jgi:hypothetical protein